MNFDRLLCALSASTNGNTQKVSSFLEVHECVFLIADDCDVEGLPNGVPLSNFI